MGILNLSHPYSQSTVLLLETVQCTVWKRGHQVSIHVALHTRSYYKRILLTNKFNIGPDRFSTHMMFLRVYSLGRSHAWMDISALFSTFRNTLRPSLTKSINLVCVIAIMYKAHWSWGRPQSRLKRRKNLRWCSSMHEISLEVCTLYLTLDTEQHHTGTEVVWS